MKKHLIFLCSMTLLLAFGFLAWVNYSLYWPITTLEIHNYSPAKPVPVLTQEIYPGQPLEYELDYCKKTDKAAIVHRSFIDGQVIALQDTKGVLPKGCHKTLVKTAIVPETINPGRYFLDVTVEYDINILRTQYIHYHTTYFTVLDPVTGEAPPTMNRSPQPEQIIIEK